MTPEELDRDYQGKWFGVFTGEAIEVVNQLVQTSAALEAKCAALEARLTKLESRYAPLMAALEELDILEHKHFTTYGTDAPLLAALEAYRAIKKEALNDIQRI